MNKKLLIACIFLMGSYSNAMDLTKAFLLGGAPVLAANSYYYVKNNKEGGLGKYNIYKGFLSGVCIGIIPYVNAGIFTVVGLVKTGELITNWFDDEKTVFFKGTYSMSVDKQKAQFVGFLSGCSLYVTIPLAFAALEMKCSRRIKMPRCKG